MTAPMSAIDRFRKFSDRLFGRAGGRTRPPAGRVADADVLECRRMLTTYTVDTFRDVDPAAIEDGTLAPDGLVSLREAVEAVNRQRVVGDAAAGTGDDRIEFAQFAEGERLLVRGEPIVIRRGVTLDGSSGDAVIEPRQSGAIFEVDTPEAVRVESLGLAGNGRGREPLVLIRPGSDVAFDRIVTGRAWNTAAFIAEDAEVTFSNSKLTGELADEGEGGSSGIAATGGTLRVYRTTIAGNDGSVPSVRVEGGRLRITAGSRVEDNARGVVAVDSDVAVRDSVFSRNGGRGLTGALVVDGGTLHAQKTIFVRNTALAGAGVNLRDAASRFETVTFTENTAGSGGGLYANNSRVAFARGSFRSNRADGGEGGGIFYRNRFHPIVLRDVRAFRNVARNGGGLYASGGLTAEALQLQENRAVKSGRDRFNGQGGGGFVTAGPTTITGTSVFRGNTATDGGGLLISSNAVRLDGLRVESGALSNNTATERGGGLSILPGCITSRRAGEPMVSIRNSRIEGASARSGGGVHMAGMRAVVSDSVIEGNDAATGGGGIEAHGGSIVLNRVTVRENQAGFQPGTPEGVRGYATGTGGGGIALLGTVAQIRESSVVGNRAVSGGGVYSWQSTVVLSGTGVLDNTALFDGGGVATFDSTVTVREGNVLRNQAGGDGGGIAHESWRKRDGRPHAEMKTLRILDSDLRGNAARSDGGGLWTNAVATFVSAAVRDNVAHLRGGGVAATDAVVRVRRDSVVTGNHAVFEGGGVAAANTSLLVEDAAIGSAALGNTATYGGGVFATDGSRVVMRDAKVRSNFAGIGGGLFIGGATDGTEDSGDPEASFAAARVDVFGDDSSVFDNVTSSTGSGAYVSGTLVLRGGTVGSNIGPSPGELVTALDGVIRDFRE